ncbi:hypothetical protein TNCV_2125091 [Trichonephila clavipes]|nr:hypothetical protein TNCV_2125091 [Trichonephila clavipes]
MFCGAKELADEIDIPANFEVTLPRHSVHRQNVNFDFEARDDPVEVRGYKKSRSFFSTQLLGELLATDLWPAYQVRYQIMVGMSSSRPSAAKDPPCRAAMHVKSYRELKCPLVGVVW